MLFRFFGQSADCFCGETKFYTTDAFRLKIDLESSATGNIGMTA